MIPMSSPAKLTDTQVALLSKASQRADRCLRCAEDAEIRWARKVAAKLLMSGLVREVKAKSGMEVWRRDEKIGQAYSLKLTAAGRQASAAAERVSQSIPAAAIQQNLYEASPKENTAANTVAACTATAAAASPAPRQGTKIARVIELLQRDQGVRLDELITATGWLPHTARASADRPSASWIRRSPGA
jgi:hypothetical protein